jgi:hypothetical protein
MKALPSAMSVSSLPIATNRVWTDKRFWCNAQTEDARICRKFASQELSGFRRKVQMRTTRSSLYVIYAAKA